MNSNTVITISRQYGCGGRELAEILAKKLNVKLYDRQIVHPGRRQRLSGSQPCSPGLTHCNAGALATADIGTALGVIRNLHDKGRIANVFADETRPLLQGARLTATELQADKIPVTLITDNMAAWVMKTRQVDAVIVGADRITANGDTANKIGTYGVALAAKVHGIPFFVAAPISTFDLSMKSGEEIPIEERNHDEVRNIQGVQTALKNTPVFNPLTLHRMNI